MAAEDHRSAKIIAERNVGREASFPVMKDVELITDRKQISGEWLHSLPYRDYGDRTEIKCSDLVEALAAEVNMGR